MKLFLSWSPRRAALGIAIVGASALAAGCNSSLTTGPPASGNAPPPPARFVDVAAKAGLNYEWKAPISGPLNILQTIGNGGAFLDYDNDGKLDILLVGPKLALYKGDGQGNFKDVTAQVGLDKLSGHFLGCGVADYDNDGYPDVYVTAYKGGALLRNRAGKSFQDVTASAGIKAQSWATSCAWAETVPGSGRLDLYVANYAVFDKSPGIKQLCEFKDTNQKQVMASCGPRYYHPIKGVLYRNDGKGHFTDISQPTGIASESGSTGKGLGVAWADFDGSGKPSLALANDEMPGDLLKPKGAKYENIGAAAGTAYDRDGSQHGGMGTDWGDYDSDGKLDLLVGTYQNEAKCLYRNDGGGLFSETSYTTGLAAPTTPFVSFGCKLFDFDNDGNLDIVIANGHVLNNIHEIDASTTYRQPMQLFRNNGKSPNPMFEDFSATSGPDLQKPIVGRGLAVGDYDNDGKLDILVVDSEGKPELLHNEDKTPAHWLGVKLVGVKSNKDGYGALLTATSGGKKSLRQCQSDGSYMSASDPRVHFGLGAADKIDTLVVKWPSGKTDTFSNLPADRYITLTEGKPLPKS